jgi:hypothetical protein
MEPAVAPPDDERRPHTPQSPIVPAAVVFVLAGSLAVLLHFLHFDEAAIISFVSVVSGLIVGLRITRSGSAK